MITADQVKELRLQTGAGMMECKKALTEAGGDMDAAIKAMRIASADKVSKKAGRIAAEGRVEVQVSQDGSFGMIAEVNCETDFVARDANFKSFVETVLQRALTSKSCDISVLSGDTLEQLRQELVAKIGENIQIRRIKMLEAPAGGTLGIYSHAARIAVIVALSNTNAELAKDLAMHIAASGPLFVSSDKVSQELLAKEKEIFMAQTAESGKPKEIIEKMVAGRMQKYLNEICLLNQPFVKDPSKTVADLLNANKAEVINFIRFEVGEGIEKVVEDFAEAVKTQIRGS